MEDGVYAVRYRQYKAHFITEGWVKYEYVLSIAIVLSLVLQRVQLMSNSSFFNHTRMSGKQMFVTVEAFLHCALISRGSRVILQGCKWSITPQYLTRSCVPVECYLSVQHTVTVKVTVKSLCLVIAASHAELVCVRVCTLITTAVPAIERLWKTLHCCLTSTGTPVRCTHSSQVTRSTTRPWASFQR